MDNENANNEVVQMLPNKKDAAWETIQYKWQPAIRALGHAYDLRRVNGETGDVIETREKQINPSKAKPQIAATRANPNVEFELWWENQGNIEGDTKEHERNAFLAGWFARQNAAARR